MIKTINITYINFSFNYRNDSKWNAFVETKKGVWSQNKEYVGGAIAYLIPQFTFSDYMILLLFFTDISKARLGVMVGRRGYGLSSSHTPAQPVRWWQWYKKHFNFWILEKLIKKTVTMFAFTTKWSSHLFMNHVYAFLFGPANERIFFDHHLCHGRFQTSS